MAQADRAVPAKRRARAGSDRPPPFQPPQLAILVDAVPTGNGWMHEIKYDGYRCLVSASGGQVRIFTRSGLALTDRIAPLHAEIAAVNLPGARPAERRVGKECVSTR